MIEHIYIKNYKAFEKENIPLEEHALLIGTNNSGKTTILEALDLFFNGRLRHDYIRDKEKDVKIECSINEKRYRKVFSPPTFFLNRQASIGDFSSLKDLLYLFVPKDVDPEYLAEELLRVNMHQKVKSLFEEVLPLAYDYLDGVKDQDSISFSRMDINLEISEMKESKSQDWFTNVLKGVNADNVIVGIDHIEDHFDTDLLYQLPHFYGQSIVTTKNDDLIKDYPYFVQALYKEDVKKETHTTLRVGQNQYDKTMLLVEGKYDVAWFEKALKLLGKYQDYRVIPCGGYGNIPHVEEQLRKAGFKTLVVTDGDVRNKTSLNREVIELYADVDYINRKFQTDFDAMPKRKWQLFKAVHTKDDVLKKVLSSWAKNHLRLDSEFVQELKEKLA
jgi:hypothetical protein